MANTDTIGKATLITVATENGLLRGPRGRGGGDLSYRTLEFMHLYAFICIYNACLACQTNPTQPKPPLRPGSLAVWGARNRQNIEL